MPVRPTCGVQRADWIRGHVADLFSSYVAAAALSAFYELGLMQRIATEGEIRLGQAGNGGQEIDSGVLHAICNTLSWAEVVEVSECQIVTRGPRFDDAFAARGYFYWLVQGCGGLVSEAGHIARVCNRTGNFYRRDMGAVAIGSRLIGDTEVEPLFDEILSRLRVEKLVDLGCGSGQRVIRIASQSQARQCLGIDISEEAVRLATAAVENLELTDRVSIIHADARNLEYDPVISDANVITCIFMGHDFWPYDQCVRTLRQLRCAFPMADRLLMCDVVRTTSPADADTAIFTLGFELVHALMGVYLPTLEEWGRAFADGGWTCMNIYELKAPSNGFLFELALAT
jgi:SAM-dependent methyltransferase